MDYQKKYKHDLKEIMDICLMFCENRNPDANTKQTFKAIYEIAERAKDDADMAKFFAKYEKTRKKTAKILQKKNHQDLSQEYFYTCKLDNY
tara:strand:+ start:296 stop:568 length:273 start_codon:yes stop_codon:yes gene_type:complete